MKCRTCQQKITWQEWAHGFCSQTFPFPPYYGNRHSITGDLRELDMRAVYLSEEQAYSRTQP